MKHYPGKLWEFDDEKLTPMRAIRKMCLQCICGDILAVKECPDQDCPLWKYRSGHTKSTRKYTQEEREEIGKRLSQAKKVKEESLK